MDKKKFSFEYIKENWLDIVDKVVGITLYSLFFLLVAILILEVYSGISTTKQLDEAEVHVGMVEDKFIGDGGRTTTLIPVGKTFVVNNKDKTIYGVIVDDKAFEIKRDEWNKITEGEEIEYKYLDSGQFRLVDEDT